MPRNIFKKQILGYSPADVSEYIEKINAQAASEIESVERSVDRLRDEKDKLKKETYELQLKLESFSDLENRIAELEKERDELAAENQKSAELLAEAEEKYNKLVADNNALLAEKEAEYHQKYSNLVSESEEKYNTLKAEFDSLSVRYNSASENENTYAKTCKDAGNILLIAQSKSEEVIEEAHKNAEIILAGAKINADEIILKAKNDANQYSAKVKYDADSYSTRIRTEADMHVETTKEKVEYLLKRQKQLLAALQSQKSEIAKFYDDTVSGLGGNSSRN